MTAKKTVAALGGTTASVTIPSAASTVVAGELEASPQVTASTAGAEGAPVVDTAAQKRIDSLAKARATKAAKAAAKKAAEIEAPVARANSIAQYQAAIAAERLADQHAFGEIREVARVAPTNEEYVRVEMPVADLFDKAHPGVQLNRHKFEPGKTYLLRGDVALEVKRRLAMFHDEQVRLLRPNADRKALADVNRGSSWTSRGGNSITPLGRLEDVPVASDEKIFTVDF